MKRRSRAGKRAVPYVRIKPTARMHTIAARIAEARWWRLHLISPWAFDDSQVGRGAVARIRKLEKQYADERERTR